MCRLYFVLNLFTVYLLLTLLQTVSSAFRLMHSSNPHVTDPLDSTRSPSTRISFLLQCLELLWLHNVSMDELTKQNKTLRMFTESKTANGVSSIAVRRWGETTGKTGISICFISIQEGIETALLWCKNDEFILYQQIIRLLKCVLILPVDNVRSNVPFSILVSWALLLLLSVVSASLSCRWCHLFRWRTWGWLAVPWTLIL